jgi:hypothetical protein
MSSFFSGVVDAVKGIFSSGPSAKETVTALLGSLLEAKARRIDYARLLAIFKTFDAHNDKRGKFDTEAAEAIYKVVGSFFRTPTSPDEPPDWIAVLYLLLKCLQYV